MKLHLKILLLNFPLFFRGKVIADPAIFASPNRMSNVILKIGDERLYVSKEVFHIGKILLNLNIKLKLLNVSTNLWKVKIKYIFQYLSVQSPVFEALFFGEFTEKGKEEVELKDVVYEVSDTAIIPNIPFPIPFPILFFAK